MNRQQIRTLALAGVLSGLTAAVTTIIKIPLPGSGGYIHPGDAIVLIAGLALPILSAAAAAGIGGAFADLLAGFAIWSPATFVIKCLMAISMAIIIRNGVTWMRLFIAGIIVIFINTIGYFIAEYIIFGNAAAPLVSVIPNSFQTLLGFGVMCSLSRIIKSIPGTNIKWGKHE